MMKNLFHILKKLETNLPLLCVNELLSKLTYYFISNEYISFQVNI